MACTECTCPVANVIGSSVCKAGITIRLPLLTCIYGEDITNIQFSTDGNSSHVLWLEWLSYNSFLLCFVSRIHTGHREHG